MNDYLTFDKFITPVIIQILFWIGAALLVIAGLLGMVNADPLSGLLVLLFGPVVWRIYMEIILVLFKIREELRAIRLQGEAKSHFS